MQEKYDILADYLSDHLWQRNNLDYDFLKQFPEFFYKGIGYRALFLENSSLPNSFINQSFSKSIEGLNKFIENSRSFDKDFTKEKNVYAFEAIIEGFDVQSALLFFRSNSGLTKSTIDNFKNEEEVICFSISNLKEFKL